jgi:hypothetical protein
MIKPLRKYHFVIWHSLALLLPLFFVMAILFRPSDPSSIEIGSNAFSATIESKTDSTYLVSLDVGKFIKTPSCVVILSDPSRELVLGTLDRQGIYTFVTPKIELPATLKLWDAIHHKTIDSVPLTQKTRE